MEEETALFYRMIPINKCRKSEGNRNSTLDDNINYYKQDPAMDAKISGQKFEEKQNICIV